MRSLGLFLVATVLVAVQLGHVLGQLANTGVVEDEGCTCVKYYQCDNNIIPTAGGPRFVVVRENQCNNSLEVCCKRRDVRLSATITDAAPCGRGNPQGVGFTLTGANDGEMNFGEFPWVVAVLRREVQEGGDKVPTAYVCGGSLIHPQVVLTAAHCVFRLTLDDLMIRAGEWDTQTTDEPYPHQERSVRKVIIHERYDDDKLFNDIALLILEEPVTTDAHINVVCLPTQAETFDHTRCFAGDWGKNVFGKEGTFAAILKRRELPIMPHSTCQNALRNALLGPYFELDDSYLCGEGETSINTNCQGDGGSPLVCPLVDKPDQFIQVGIMAWGLGCADISTPGVYANVAMRRNWIDQKMVANNFNTDSYTY